jgi:SAM-dependent methyltransferase
MSGTRRTTRRLLIRGGSVGRAALFKLARPLLQNVPATRRPFWRLFYELGANVLDRDFTFMNLGFLDPSRQNGAGSSADGPDITERLSALLYEHVVDGTALAGRRVLEVGSGRGGGSAHLAREHRPAAVMGVDASRNLVKWARSRHSAPNLSFVRGDALAVPFPDESFDVVVNIESSHCYPSRLRFFEEVSRVLRPHGRFLFADILYPTPETNGPDGVERLFEQAGMRMVAGGPITREVVAARQAVSESDAFRARMTSAMPPWSLPTFWEGYCLAGSADYRAMSSGELEYWCWSAERLPAPSPPASTRAGAHRPDRETADRLRVAAR